MGSRPNTEEYDSQSQHELDGWTASHMVFSVTNTAFKDGVVTTKAIHLGQSFGDCNEIA